MPLPHACYSSLFHRTRAALLLSKRALRGICFVTLSSMHQQTSASGSEMAGLKLAIPITLGLAVLVLLLFAGLIAVRLPKTWSRPRRWLTALLLAVLALGSMLLLMSGPNVIHMLLIRLSIS